LALTLNGKKAKLKRKDFLIFGRALGIPEKVAAMVIETQIIRKTSMFDWVDRSFLTAEQKVALRALVEENISVISQ
jgi:hypothetical protein